MTSRIQEQRFTATATKPANGARPSGEIWLNLPDLRLGLIDPTYTAVDLLGVRQYAATSSYAGGDYVVHAGDLLRAKAAITPHAFAATDWDSLSTQAQNDARYTTQAQNDARYYTKTYIDSTYYTRTYIDTNLYTRIQSDARYYTQTQSDGRYLQLTGGVLSGELTVGGGGVHYTQAGGSNHAMALGWDGSHILAWVDGTSIGALATQAYVTSTEANYLLLTGGTITGNLQVNGTGTVLGTLQNSNGRLITYAPNFAPSLTLWQGNLGAMGFYYDGNLNYGGFDGTGSLTAYYGRFRSDGSIEASNRLISATGVFANTGQDFGLYQSGQYRFMQFASSWGLLWDTTNGNLIYQTGGSFTFSIDSGGSIHGQGATFAGDVTINGGGTALSVPGGSINCQGQVYGVTVYSGSDATIGGRLYVQGAGGGNVLIVQGGDYYGYGGMTISSSALKPGGGMWLDSSDRRTKKDIADYTRGLDALLQLNPVSFRHNGRGGTADDGVLFVGLIADDVRPVMPEMVGGHEQKLDPDDDHPTEILTLDATALVYALVNSVKALNAKIEALEART